MNYSCDFNCGLFRKLRDDCSSSCRGTIASCSAALPQISNRSYAFEPACETWCCNDTNSLVIAVFVVVAIIVVLVISVLSLLIWRHIRKHMQEKRMENVLWTQAPVSSGYIDDLDAAIEQAAPQNGGDVGTETTTHVVSQHPRLFTDMHQLGGNLPPSQLFAHVPMDVSGRRSIMYDGEISLGFADEDFVVTEADRADGVSVAGSHMSRRSLPGSVIEMGVVNSGGQEDRRWPFNTTPRVHDGSASPTNAQPVSRPASGSRRKDSQSGGVTWDLFTDEVDVGQLERSRSIRQSFLVQASAAGTALPPLAPSGTTPRTVLINIPPTSSVVPSSRDNPLPRTVPTTDTSYMDVDIDEIG